MYLFSLNSILCFKILKCRKRGLLRTLCNIIWGIAKISKQCFLVVDDTLIETESDFEIDNMKYYRIKSYKQLYEEIESNIEIFSNENGLGLICLVVSCVLSRGIKNLKSDMSMFGGSLIVEYAYWSQELVSLLLLGKAYSNVFDDTKEIGTGEHKQVLQGISEKSNIGFLTEFEIEKHVIVGENLKTPKFLLH